MLDMIACHQMRTALGFRAHSGWAAILASHPLLHTAEGQMFRDVLSWAASRCNLPVMAVPEKQLPAASLSAMDSLGRTIGPPWTQDQKYDTLAALLALVQLIPAQNS